MKTGTNKAMTEPWQEIQDKIGRFTDETFGGSTVESKMAHLREEIQEVIDAPEDKMEWADCMILLLDAARRAGLSMDDLHQAIEDKLAINMKRKWGAPDKDGVVRHVA